MTTAKSRFVESATINTATGELVFSTEPVDIPREVEPGVFVFPFYGSSHGIEGTLRDETLFDADTRHKLVESVRTARFAEPCRVGDASCMFANLENLETCDLSNLCTSSTVSMSYMFENCVSLRSLDVSGFDTSNVETMSRMFQFCESLESVDVSGFDVSFMVYVTDAFNGCVSLDLASRQGIAELAGKFDNPVHMFGLPSRCYAN